MLKIIYGGDITYSDVLKPSSASSSITYIEAEPKNKPENINQLKKLKKLKKLKIVVDTSTKDKKELLINKFEELDLKFEEIDYVINTHSHFDHVGNNNLFKNATIINYNNYKKFADEFSRYGIEIIETLGHTMDSIAVVYDDYVVAGDAIPVKNNIFRNLPPKVRENEKLATESLNKIKNLKKNIITGHNGLLKIDEYLNLIDRD
ncbi:MBL fold metallo-hydrolase [Methanococcus voltae]|uniref:Metallo-beta-lactamase domain-containing protein 1 n=1 Tax=Methanococcus voltae (strain ATCC BAA-1334 / A3) TaxID=456320 RepID=D7DSH5_METV3|nr:MBL fold metallo-hydrolase [Methanococcus voltae]MCS3901611.1 glyoxylase-like metal-dependent hydrolase (beta-lactamase superfamily II) [Methanococcus voltae]